MVSGAFAVAVNRCGAVMKHKLGARSMRTMLDIETALKSGELWVAMTNGKYWKVRRNGKTQTWKREPNRFRIPIKYGLKGYGEITQDSLQSDELVISREQPKPWKG
jgi:hypothetical protein